MTRKSIRRRAVRSITVAAVLSIIPVSAGVAQVAPADSLRADTLYAALPDSVRRVDSVDPIRPFFPTASPFGSIVPSYSPAASRFISELALASMRYFTAFDALRRSVPAFPLSQGTAGLVRGFSLAGASPSAVSVSYNGRPLEGLAAYGYDLELYPMEHLERAEIVTGARALLYGTGEALMSVNFVQPRLDVEASYVRAWFAQDASDLTGGDLLFSRNVGRRANLALGFRRIATGNQTNARFENQEISNWVLRGNLTWRPLPSLMVSLTELFADATRSQNGGLAPESPFSTITGNHEVLNLSWEERTLRHDVTLAAEWIVGGRSTGALDTVLAAGAESGRLDSAMRIDAAAYASIGERTIESFDSVIVLDGRPLRSERSRFGVRAGLWVPLASLARLEVNGIAELVGSRDRGAGATSYDLGRRQAGVLIELPVGGGLALRGAGRFSQGEDGQIGGAAAELVLRPSDRLTARIGARLQRHDCPCADPMGLIDSVPAIRFESMRTAMLAEGELTYADSTTLLSLSGFARQSVDPEAGAGGEGVLFIGAEGRLRLPVWLLVLESHVHGALAPEGDRRFPMLRAFGDLHAPLRLVDGALNLRVGTTLEYQTPFAGVLYDIVTGSFAYRTGAEIPTFHQFPLWDAYAQARIGTAYVRLAMRNILNVESWSVYRYPERGRSIMLAVTWSFID